LYATVSQQKTAIFVSITPTLAIRISMTPAQGLLLFGAGGFGLFMTTFHVATLFPARQVVMMMMMVVVMMMMMSCGSVIALQGTVLSVFNGAFDCGVVFFGEAW